MISRRSKRVILGFASGLIVLFLFVTVLTRYFAAIEHQQWLDERRAEIRETPPHTHTVSRGTETQRRQYSARLEPWRHSRVAAEVSGRVAEMPFESGDHVGSGDILAVLDDSLAQLRVRSSKASLDAALARLNEFERQEREAERLATSRALPETRLFEARSQVEVQTKEVARLESELERERELLDRHRVRAPFSGIVGERLVETGDSVSAYQPVAELAKLDPLRVVFHLSENEAALLALDQGMTVSLPRTPDGIPIELKSLAPVADRRTGTLRAEALLPNEELRYRGGAAAVVEATVDLYEDYLFVPTKAVRFEGEQAYVERPAGEGGGNASVPVRLGPEIRGKYPVLSGLEEGEEVLIR